VLAHVAVVPQHAHRHVGGHLGQLPQDVVERPAEETHDQQRRVLRGSSVRQGSGPRIMGTQPQSHPRPRHPGLVFIFCTQPLRFACACVCVCVCAKGFPPAPDARGSPLI
jgi:hypothetical protein